MRLFVTVNTFKYIQNTFKYHSKKSLFYVLVTDHGVAVNPKRADVRELLESKGIEVVDIELLCQRAMTLTGEPAPIEFDEQIVGYVRYRDGSVIDVIRRVKQ